MDRKLFAARLKKRRVECGYTSQTAFAQAYNERFIHNWRELMGNNPTGGILGTLKSYENPNGSDPSLDKVANMCILLNCDIDYLLGNINEPKHIYQAMHERFGLSQKATEHLIYWSRPHVRYSEMLNIFLESANFENALHHAIKVMKLKPTLDGLIEIRNQWVRDTFSGPPDCGTAYNYTGDNGLADMIREKSMEYDSNRLYLDESLTFLVRELEALATKEKSDK